MVLPYIKVGRSFQRRSVFRSIPVDLTWLRPHMGSHRRAKTGPELTLTPRLPRDSSQTGSTVNLQSSVGAAAAHWSLRSSHSLRFRRVGVEAEADVGVGVISSTLSIHRSQGRIWEGYPTPLALVVRSTMWRFTLSVKFHSMWCYWIRIRISSRTFL